MKICYVDESGTGEEPIAVMAGVVSGLFAKAKNEIIHFSLAKIVAS